MVFSELSDTLTTVIWPARLTPPFLFYFTTDARCLTCNSEGEGLAAFAAFLAVGLDTLWMLLEYLRLLAHTTINTAS